MKSDNNTKSRFSKWIVYAIVAISIGLVYFFILKPLAVLFNPPTAIEYSRNITELIKVIAWPFIVIISLLILRKPLGVFLEKIAGRASKLSVFKVEIELSAVATLEPINVPSLSNIQQLDSTALTTDSSGILFQQIQSADRADYAIIDLGSGKEWLASRLYIFSVMLERMRGLKYLVFLNTSHKTIRSFMGVATPKKVRWCLAQNYPWLEWAYTNACTQLNGVVHAKADFTYLKIIKSGDGGLESHRASMLVNNFLQSIQVMETDPPAVRDGWTKLRDTKWERSSLIDESSLVKLLESNLIDSRASHLPDLQESAQAKIILRRQGDVVGLVNDDGRFLNLINRKALLEKLAEMFNKPEEEVID